MISMYEEEEGLSPEGPGQLPRLAAAAGYRCMLLKHTLEKEHQDVCRFCVGEVERSIMAAACRSRHSHPIVAGMVSWDISGTVCQVRP